MKAKQVFIILSFIFLMPCAGVIAQTIRDTTEKVYTTVDEMPQYPGGEQRMFYFISKNIQYPTKAFSREKEGKVYISCIVDTDGTVRDPRVTKGIKNGCDEEALRVISKMPKWIPGKQSGAPVKVALTIPVEFKINTKEKLQQEGNRKSYDLYNHGLELMKEKKFFDAMQSFDMEIALNEEGYNAYNNRGVSKLLMADTAEACRDWGLAAYYGDKEVIEQLENLCNSQVVVDDDTFHIESFKNTGENNPFKENDSSVPGGIMPQFPGGLDAMLNFLGRNIKYPALARRRGVTGQVFIRYYINKKGKVRRPYVIRSIGGGCDEEALRVIQLMPDWKPGTVFGKPVPVLFNQPVRFTIK